MDEGVTLHLNGPQRMVVTQVVSASDMARTNALDLKAWTEARVLAQLVQAVHKEGRVGTTWPEVTAMPERWEYGEPVDCEPEDAEQWRVVASVTAVPRG